MTPRSNRRATLLAMSGAAGIVNFPTAAITVALPTIHGQFDASLAELQWVVTAAYIPFTAFLIAAGRLSDIFGRRRVLLIGLVLLAIGSAVAGFAPNATILIAGSALTGAGNALCIPSSMSIVSVTFTGRSRGVALGVWAGATEIVSGIGVLIGGVLTEHLSWRWIFLVGIPVAVAIGLAALRWTPESRDPDAIRKVDVPGVVLTASGLTALSLALIQGATWGWTSPVIVLLFAASVLLGGAFVVVERRTANPIIRLSLFKRRNFSGAVITIFVIDFSFGALLFFLPLYFQEVLDYSPVETGLVLLPMTVLMVAASPLGGKAATRTGPRPPIVIGLAMMAGAVLWISMVNMDTTYADLWLPTVIAGFGLGFALTPMNLAAMNSVSKQHSGGAAGVLITMSGLASTLGVAATGALFQSANSARTVEYAGEAGVTLTDAQAQELDGLLAGSSQATEALHQLAPGRTNEVETAVREAFVSALSFSLKLSAVVVFLGAVLAALLLRRQPPVDEESVEEPVASPAHRPASRHFTHWKHRRAA